MSGLRRHFGERGELFVFLTIPIASILVAEFPAAAEIAAALVGFVLAIGAVAASLVCLTALAGHLPLLVRITVVTVCIVVLAHPHSAANGALLLARFFD